MDEHDTALRLTRESRGDLIAEAITEAFGERCSEDQPGCACCDAWTQYDCLLDRTEAAEAEVATLRRYVPAHILAQMEHLAALTPPPTPEPTPE